MYFSISRRSKIAPDFGDIQGCSGTSFDTAKKGAIEDVYYEGRNITLLFRRPDAAFTAIERKHGRNQRILTTAHQRHRLLTTWEGFLQVNLCKTVYNYNIKGPQNSRRFSPFDLIVTLTAGAGLIPS